MVSFTLDETVNTAKSTKKLPKLAAITILHFETSKPVKAVPKKLAPNIMIATAKLAPELIPSTNAAGNYWTQMV